MGSTGPTSDIPPTTWGGPPIPGVGVNQTGNGSSPLKPPVVTTSPIGITTTTVYDKNGNSASTITDPTGKILEKTTTMLHRTGGSMRITANAEGKILSTTTKTPNKEGGYISVIMDNKVRVSRSVHNSAGEIVSQGAKTMTSKTGTGGTYSSGKGHKESFLGDVSKKYKEKGMNELFREEKQNVKQLDSGASSSPAPSHAQGRHR